MPKAARPYNPANTIKSGRPVGSGGVRTAAENKRVHEMIKIFMLENYMLGKSARACAAEWNENCEPNAKRSENCFHTIAREVRRESLERNADKADSAVEEAIAHLRAALSVDQRRVMSAVIDGDLEELDASELAGIGIKGSGKHIEVTTRSIEAAKELLRHYHRDDKTAVAIMEIFQQAGDRVGLQMLAEQRDPMKALKDRWPFLVREAPKE